MKQRKKLKVIVMVVTILTIIFFAQTAFAVDIQQGMDPLEAMNNLVDFILSIVTVVGVIALIWGGVQLALALKSQDGATCSAVKSCCTC